MKTITIHQEQPCKKLGVCYFPQDFSCGGYGIPAETGSNGEAKTVKVILTGAEKKNLEITSLTADALTAENTFDCPDYTVIKRDSYEDKGIVGE